jgi:hypothetical protein
MQRTVLSNPIAALVPVAIYKMWVISAAIGNEAWVWKQVLDVPGRNEINGSDS